MNDVRAILWAAMEDYAGLWESVWELRSLHPDLDTPTLEARAKEIIEALFADGFLDLYWCDEPYGDMTLIDRAEGPRLLDIEQHWHVPDNGTVAVRFSATDAGEHRAQQLGPAD